VYGYLNNPMLQPHLSLIPLATCFDYAAAPGSYDAERSWTKTITQQFSQAALRHWRAIRRFCDEQRKANNRREGYSVAPADRARLRAALAYVETHRAHRWAAEIRPWTKAMQQSIK
jgi:O-succinylbenzoate synthase